MTKTFNTKIFSTAAIITLGIATSACQVTTDHLKTHVNDRGNKADLQQSVTVAAAAKQETAGNASGQSGQSGGITDNSKKSGNTETSQDKTSSTTPSTGGGDAVNGDVSKETDQQRTITRRDDFQHPDGSGSRVTHYSDGTRSEESWPAPTQ